MGLITRIADKAGALGSVVSAMGCAPVSRLSPAWARPSALAFYRNTKGCLSPLLPLFAVVALLANALGWLSHRQWYRSLLGMVGPAIVLAAMLLFLAIGGRRTSSMSVWP
jgi:mercuric ion transport protein